MTNPNSNKSGDDIPPEPSRARDPNNDDDEDSCLMRIVQERANGNNTEATKLCEDKAEKKRGAIAINEAVPDKEQGGSKAGYLPYLEEETKAEGDDRQPAYLGYMVDDPRELALDKKGAATTTGSTTRAGVSVRNVPELADSDARFRAKGISVSSAPNVPELADSDARFRAKGISVSSAPNTANDDDDPPPTNDDTIEGGVEISASGGDVLFVGQPTSLEQRVGHRNNNNIHQPNSQPGAIPMHPDGRADGNEILEEVEEEVEEPALLPEPDEEDGLAQATAVSGSQAFDLPHATQVDGQSSNKKASGTAFFALALLLLALVLALGLGLGLKKKQQQQVPPALLGTPAPSRVALNSEFPSSAPTGNLGSLIQNLPKYTRKSLETYGTPQWLALDWLSNHPDLSTMEEWRMEQLFALVTFYHSFGGEHWREDIRKDWIEYDVSECFWFTSKIGIFNPNGKWGTHDWGLAYPDPCNEHGVFVHLQLDNLVSVGNDASIPPEISLLTSLENLMLHNGGLNGTMDDVVPSQVHQMMNLSTFSLSGNRLFGTIPSWVTTMTSLRELNLNSNFLTGTIPSQLGLLTILRGLAVNVNPLSGTIPSELGQTQLAYLLAYNNDLTGSIPTEIGLLSHLNRIRFTDNMHTGPLPSQLGLLTQLTQLELWANSFSGTLATELGLMRNLTRWAIDSNQISGTIPTELGQLTNWEYAWWHSNELNGTIPSEMGLSPWIEFWMWNNRLTGSIPIELFSNPKWRECGVHFNSLNGTIPTEIGLATSLGRFRIQFNKISGTIPSQVALLPDVGTFVVRGNMLNGTIPTEIGIMQGLQILELSQNLFTGRVPSELGSLNVSNTNGAIPHLSKLQSMSLGRNQLTGPIPSQLGLLSALEALLLENTLVSGSIPPQLGSLSQLGALDLSKMPLLSGTIPEAVSNLTLKILEIDGSSKLSGAIVTSLCNIAAAPCEVTYRSMRYQRESWDPENFILNRWGSQNCTLQFDCSDQLCGCDCPCSNSSLDV